MNEAVSGGDTGGDVEHVAQAPMSDRGSPQRNRLVGLGWVALVVSLSLLAFSVPAVDYDRVDGLGLIRALPAIYWVSIAVLTVAFLAFVARRHRRGSALSVLVLVVALHGIEPMSAPRGRFSVAWLLAGFSDMLERTGATQRFYDARFSWPGFFFGPAASVSVDDRNLLDQVVRYWPLLIFFVWVGAVWAFARRFFPDLWSAAPIAAWVFTMTAWTGQNYFSPQSIGATVVVIITLLITMLEPDPLPDASIRRRLEWLFLPDPSGGQSKLVMGFLLILVAAVVVTHPLSPVFLMVWIGVLAVTGHRYARGLTTMTFGLWFVWVANMARPWWRTRIEELVGNVGDLGGTVGASTSERAAGASAERSFVLLGRTSLVLAIGFVTLCLGLYLWRRRGYRSALVMLLLAAGPGLAVAGQPYGGEIIVRVFLFSVFPAAVLLGFSIAMLRRWPAVLNVAIVVVTLVGAPTLVLTRYGNEAYEMTRVTDFEALDAMYRLAPDDTLFLTDNPFLSWQYTRIERVDGFRNHRYFGARLEPDNTTVVRAVEFAKSNGFDHVAIVTTESQEQWGEEVAGWEDGWLEEVAAYLEGRTDVETLYRVGASGAFVIDIVTEDGAQ